jgi:UDP-3-O-[3-hydroxymyristoyl] glucosamine N-acyltransferase
MAKVTEIKKLMEPVECVIVGNPEREFNDAKSICEASSGDLTFCSRKGKEATSLIEKSKASVIICNTSALSRTLKLDDKTVIAVSNPRLWFIRCLNAFFPSQVNRGIHSTAIIGKNCQFGDNVYVGPYTCIGDDVLIGSGTRIYSGVHIFDKVRIRKNVIIKSGSIIGSDGFGYERNEEGILEKFPHRGSVIIEDNVEIGANTCIDRGTLSDSVIGRGTKIDNLVHIAHNVTIGQNCVIVCLSCIGGGTRIGDGAWIAPLACIRDGISIGQHSTVGMGAVVTKNVKNHDVVAGVPARSIKKVKKDEEGDR